MILGSRNIDKVAYKLQKEISVGHKAFHKSNTTGICGCLVDSPKGASIILLLLLYRIIPNTADTLVIIIRDLILNEAV